MSAFENNISYIKSYNISLYNRLLNTDLNDIEPFEFVQSQSGDTNLAYKNLLLHSEVNPQQEAMEIFNKFPNHSHYSVCIMLGLGLGYLMKRFSLSSETKVIVYEPDINLLRLVFEVVDFSEDFQKGNIFITNTFEECQAKIEEHYVFSDYMGIVQLKSATTLYSKEFAQLNAAMPEIMHNLSANYFTLFDRSKYWLFEGTKNIPEFSQYNSFEALRGKLSGKPAIVVSSGPSLTNQAENLLKINDKAFIFCAGSAYKTLRRNNITPDFVSFIESHTTTIYQVKDEDLSDSYIINLPIALNDLFQLNAKDKFVMYSRNDLVSRWVSKICNFSIADYLVKSNVAYLSLMAAFLAGCNPIVLLGQDLSYSDGNCYCKGSNYDFLYCEFDETLGKYVLKEKDKTAFIEKIKKDNKQVDVEFDQNRYINALKANLCTVNGQNGEKLPSVKDFAGVIDVLEQFASENGNNVNLYNASIGGAQINGFQNSNILDILSNFEDIKNKKDFIFEQIKEMPNPVQNNSSTLKAELKVLYSDLIKFTTLADQGLKTVERLRKELKSLHYNIKIIQRESNALLKMYSDFKDLLAKHEIFSACAFREILELTKIMDTGDAKDPIKDLTNICNYSSNFYAAFKMNAEILAPIMNEALDNATAD